MNLLRRNLKSYNKGMDAKETAIKTFFISNVDKVTKIAERLKRV
jgi:hypothetical protein